MSEQKGLQASSAATLDHMSIGFYIYCAASHRVKVIASNQV
ncbi:hypothetical protein [Pseudomonas frederiksbergensis]|nr:hypothetical protein [Pseudomonas frederiksbergensis]